MFIAWPEIEGFHNIRKYTKAHPEILNGNSVVQYRAKVKLHGTNAAVQCHSDGSVVAQSRTQELSVSSDNAGFARWVKENEAHWANATKYVSTYDSDVRHVGFIFYGEWIGPGIQKGVAVSEIPKKSFAVFAARPLGKDGNVADDVLITNPGALQLYVKDIPDTYVLPWYDKAIEINWSSSAEDLTVKTSEINEWVSEIEKNDPWVQETFKVSGTGEGLVFYPCSRDHVRFTDFSNLVFKAKGEKHKNIKTAAPAQIDAEAAASIDAFIDLVLTPARLEQGAKAVSPDLTFDIKLTGNFVNWITADVEKETQDELEASNLSWKDVSKPLANKARAWYITKSKELK